MDTAALVHEILGDYPLDIRGHHGVVHWARVLENGLKLAEATGANVEVVTLFALFHDSRRVNQGHDPGHGLRGGKYARTLRGTHIHLNDGDFELLYEACRLHTDGHCSGNITLQTCWDADRLDLGRVNITPDPDRLCTNAARDLLRWADDRACSEHEPEIVCKVWQL